MVKMTNDDVKIHVASSDVMSTEVVVLVELMVIASGFCLNCTVGHWPTKARPSNVLDLVTAASNN